MDSFTQDDLREMVLRLAHEIRNPLATIKSSVQLVEHLTHPEGEIAEYLESVIDEVTRIDQTVREMQAFVRLKPGSPTDVPVDEVVREAFAEARHEAARRGVRLIARPGPPLVVRADRVQIRLALDALLANAVSATPVESSVRLWWQPDGERVRIHVEDSGAGVPPELAGRIMRPFFSTSTQGAGLGLNIVQKVAHLAGGETEWRTLEAGGCRFPLVLPTGGRAGENRWPAV